MAGLSGVLQEPRALTSRRRPARGAQKNPHLLLNSAGADNDALSVIRARRNAQSGRHDANFQKRF